TKEAGRTTQREGPPRPRFPQAKWKERDPQVQHPNRDEDSAKRNAIVDHEMQDPTVVQRAELPGSHAEINRVVREQLAGRRLKNGEASTRDKKDRGDEQQRAAVAHGCLHEAAIVLCQKRSLTGRKPAPAKYGSSRRPSSGQL